MKIFKKNNSLVFLQRILTLVALISLFFFKTLTPISANQSPVGCTGSGLGINLFSSLTQVHIGDTINFTVEVFNGTGSGPVVCDASGIQAFLVTPDGVSHPLTLTRTTLSSGQSDTYPNIVSYVARAQDVDPNNGTLPATASDTGVIHQNVVDSSGGANQGLNVFVLNTLHVIKVVDNINGYSAVAGDFNLHVLNNLGADVSGSPAAGTGTPGTLYSIIAGTYIVTEDANPFYTYTFSGDCDEGGHVSLLAGDNKTCTVTNHDIIPSPTPTTSPIPTPTTTTETTTTDNSNSNSTPGTPVCPTIPPEIVAPLIIDSRRVDANSLYLSWGPYSGTDQFTIEYGPTNGNWLYNTKVTGFSATLGSLPSNQPMWVRIAARNECQFGSFGEAKLIGVGRPTSVGFPNTGNPLLPDTGFAPSSGKIPWFILSGLSLSFVTFLLVRKISKFTSK